MPNYFRDLEEEEKNGKKQNKTKISQGPAFRRTQGYAHSSWTATFYLSVIFSLGLKCKEEVEGYVAFGLIHAPLKC